MSGYLFSMWLCLRLLTGHLSGELVLRSIIFKTYFQKSAEEHFFLNPYFFFWTAGAKQLKYEFAILIIGGWHFGIQKELFGGCDNNFSCSDVLWG